jgi:hypothetical protein
MGGGMVEAAAGATPGWAASEWGSGMERAAPNMPKACRRVRVCSEGCIASNGFAGSM